MKVVTTNPVSNLTAELTEAFWVQRPPTGLHFCNLPRKDAQSVYPGKVGESVTLCANVTRGDNVTFDWKLGDQTDLVNAGKLIRLTLLL